MDFPENEAHLWIVRSRDARAPSLLAAYEELLTDDEREKRDRYRFEKDRHTCLVTRALVRTTLSRYADVAPDAWRFVTNEHGRPEISEPASARWLRFNLSHTNGLVVCLVARGRRVGVDVEDRERSGRLLDVAERYFSTAEVEALRSLPRPEQLERFFLYWTLKESYIKARGMGLAIPLGRFSFALESVSERGIRIQLDPRLEDDPERWWFTVMSHGRRHLIAASVESRGEPVVLAVREVLPLG